MRSTSGRFFLIQKWTSAIIGHRWFSWIPSRLTLAHFKPVARCAIAAWIGLLLQLIRPTEAALGYAAFFVLVIAFMIPPALPFIQSLEIYINLYSFAAIGWAWTALGVFIAGQIRVPLSDDRIAEARAKWAPFESSAASLDRRLIFEGTYIEARSASVLAVFLGVGTGTFLWYKMRTQPSPATFPLVLSCILMDIGLTTAALYPTPYYTSGLLFFLPMAVQGGIAILCSLVVFPESVSHSFLSKIRGVLAPMSQALDETVKLFERSNLEIHDWAEHSRAIRQKLLISLDGIPPLRTQKRYLRVDISYGLLSPRDAHEIFDRVAALQARSGGLAFFFDVLVTNTLHAHLDSSAWSAHNISIPHSQTASGLVTPDEHPRPPSRAISAEHLAHTLLRLSHRTQRPVGLWESQRYMDVERPFADDTADALEQLDILSNTAHELVSACHSSLNATMTLAASFSASRPPAGAASVLKSHRDALARFHKLRLKALASYRRAFETGSSEVYRKVHFRNLFQSFVAQYHLIEFSEALIDTLELMESLRLSRTRRRFWTPKLSDLIAHSRGSEDGRGNDVPMYEDDVLGLVKRRDPESTPFDSSTLDLLSRLTRLPDLLGTRSFAFLLKAGVLTVLTALPQFLKQSAAFYYYNRGIWCTIMAQMTLAVFAGDTAGAWIARVVASFWGALLGTVVWYIGCGASSGNAFGLGAICAATFPLAMFFRLHFPGQVLTSVMTTVTFALVIGYSYLNGTVGALTDAKWGFDVAWRRLVCVLIGITSAYIFSYLPPAYSSKRAIRQSYAGVIVDTGSILCGVLSQANLRSPRMANDPSTRNEVLTLRAKLAKLGARHANAKLEYSLRGRWPEERYRALLEALRDSLLLLHQFHHVLTQMDMPWRQLLLNRTRFDDPLFLGDVLAVFSMTSTALAAGTALPQITPSPLVARFRMGKTKGLELPAHLTHTAELVTIDVMESVEYMRYALGITTSFSLLARLDRIVVICKTLLGEHYHVSGIHL
ncbi:hypothetical protein BD324DRAFT_580777 [Kockovaella imperatae]|uniref:ER transporter 6TM N-terminal domain-containing protein n=1 Tax=Kockovaella imperatae TaxID=4999 RepID=A0A1Y1UEH7_9TREE|nr:hypothetical protein BD324DRAFT_580777 [Kockovaella imperatae]ORX36432.1 hypothetical protein BD324DRAFT_580777 [Kockovaella imperatae]